MEKQILEEIRALKNVISHLIGTVDLPVEQKFSKEALDKAGEQFQKLAIERGDWIQERDISKYIKTAPYSCGTFIREEFVFANYFKRGRAYYYNRRDLISLAKELKNRNVDLKRYMEYKQDYDKFKKKVESVRADKGKAFKLPETLRDFYGSPAKRPSVDLITADIEKLKNEFNELNLDDYVDVFNDSYAMVKPIYFFQKYIDPQVLKKCRKWCDNFNYAQHALQEVTY